MLIFHTSSDNNIFFIHSIIFNKDILTIYTPINSIFLINNKKVIFKKKNLIQFWSINLILSNKELVFQ